MTHIDHVEAHRRFLTGARWLHWYRTRWWWKPWTWGRAAGEWIDTGEVVRAHIARLRAE